MDDQRDTDGTAPVWLNTPIGSALLSSERDQLRQALEGVFGEHLLQIGRWGDARGFKDLSRTQHAVTVYCASQQEGADVCADFARLPFDSNSIDAIVLPHTLDMAVSPHDVLREVHRVLRSDGKLLMLGFKPFGLWGMRRLLSRGTFPAGINHALGERTLRDWLQLLDLRVENHHRFFFKPPFDRFASGGNEKLAHTAQRWFPELAACYLLQARKRVAAITPIRPRWHRRARVVGGITEPSMRNVVKLIRTPDSNDGENG